MKKTAIIAGSFLLAACLTMSTNGLAGNASMGQVSNHMPNIPKNIPKIPKLPDLTVTNIQAVQNGQGRCFLRVSVRNNGPGAVPDAIYNARTKVGIQMYVDNKPGGGMALSMFDAGRNLRHPHKTVTRDWFKSDNNLLHAGIMYTVKVIADSNSELAEANESNNVLVKRLLCGPRIK